MAVSRATKVSAASNYTTGIPGAPKRVSFANIREPLEVPDLLDLQVQSFEWLVGDETWFQRRVDAGDESPVGGLEEVARDTVAVGRRGHPQPSLTSFGDHRLHAAPVGVDPHAADESKPFEPVHESGHP